jgi:hypothetical protein
MILGLFLQIPYAAEQGISGREQGISAQQQRISAAQMPRPSMEDGSVHPSALCPPSSLKRGAAVLEHLRPAIEFAAVLAIELQGRGADRDDTVSKRNTIEIILRKVPQPDRIMRIFGTHRRTP